MRRILIAGLISLALLAGPSLAATATQPRRDAEVIRDWNNLAFSAARQAKASDAVAARLYAMVNTAMYDAVNGLSSHPHWSVFVAPSAANAGDPSFAAAAAAHRILSALFPAIQSDYDAQLGADRAAAQSPGQATLGEAWGTQVANAVLAARANDGSSPPESRGPVNEVGKFRGTFGGRQFRNLVPFAIADPATYETATVPALTSSEYATAFNEVKARGRDDGDTAAKATFDYWSLGGGTNQPPGAWLQVTQIVSEQRGLSLADTARLFALESMALVDTVAPTYTVKDVNYHWRPVDAIREADLDGNPDTAPYAGTWKPRGGNSGSPEFWSGHSTFSTAGAAVLATFFCDDDISFTLTTDSAGGTARTYSSFSEAAQEAGDSRVIGGLHFPFSNFTAADAGKAIAGEVMQREPAC